MNTNEERKCCTKCGCEFPVEAFRLKGKTRYSWCRSCENMNSARWRKKNPDKYKDAVDRWRQKNGDKLRRNSERYREKNRTEINARSRNRRAERTLKEVIKDALKQSARKSKRCGYRECTTTAEEIESAFTGFCHSCGISEVEHRTKLCIDHDHETGVFRGWLCNDCNTSDALAVVQ